MGPAWGPVLRQRSALGLCVGSPSQASRRLAISADIPDCPWIRRDNVSRATPNCFAASVTDRSKAGGMSSRIDSPGCGLLCIRPMIPGLSVVVLIVDENGIFALELERQSPASAHLYSPMTFLLAFQSMELPTRLVHVLGAPCNIQSLKLTCQPCSVHRLNTRLGPFQEEAYNAVVAATPDHGNRFRVTIHASAYAAHRSASVASWLTS